MHLLTDKQTLDDLNIFGKRGNDSIYALFNQTATRGGATILEQFFRSPLANEQAINERSSTIRYFQQKAVAFPFESSWFDAAEQYLESTDERSRITGEENTLGRKFNNLIGADTEYKQLVKGISATISIIQTLHVFVSNSDTRTPMTPYHVRLQEIRQLLLLPSMDRVIKEAHPGNLSYSSAADYDKLLRYTHRQSIQKMLQEIYLLDVYVAIAKVATQHGFVFPTALPAGEHTVRLKGLYHPRVANAIRNDLLITPDSNIIFLTGANMAGKSTFMKSLGIALYLAHTGLPVAASEMEFSVRDGIFTTINLPDDLSLGYSHFYAEVLRVKKVASQLSMNRNLFIIFDELFRGTNVKDAYEATVALTAAFAKRHNCMFVVSTHIIEAGEALKKRCHNINFTYLPTRMEGNNPVYTYRLEKGITADRHGMIIINNEGIINILKNRKYKSEHA